MYEYLKTDTGKFINPNYVEAVVGLSVSKEELEKSFNIDILQKLQNNRTIKELLELENKGLLLLFEEVLDNQKKEQNVIDYTDIKIDKKLKDNSLFKQAMKKIKEYNEEKEIKIKTLRLHQKLLKEVQKNQQEFNKLQKNYMKVDKRLEKLETLQNVLQNSNEGLNKNMLSLQEDMKEIKNQNLEIENKKRLLDIYG